MSDNNVYSKTVTTAYADFDVHDMMLPSKYLSLFQDMAGEHAEILGCGYSASLKRDLMWVIVRSRLDIYDNPVENEELNVSTKIKKPIGLVFEREVEVRGKNNNKLYATGLTAWCVANRTTRRLVRPSDISYPDVFEGPYLYDTSLKSIPVFEKKETPDFTHRVVFTDLDHNLHTNNCKYADVLTNALSPKAGQRFKYLEIDFEKECVEGETLSLYLEEKTEGPRRALAYKDNGQLSFKCIFELVDTQK